jgi:hypothetical protein
MSPPDSQSDGKVYASVAHAVLDPRELGASLLLKAATKLKTRTDHWTLEYTANHRQ